MNLSFLDQLWHTDYNPNSLSGVEYIINIRQYMESRTALEIFKKEKDKMFRGIYREYSMSEF